MEGMKGGGRQRKEWHEGRGEGQGVEKREKTKGLGSRKERMHC